MSKNLPSISMIDILPPNLCDDKNIVAAAKSIDAINQYSASKLPNGVLVSNIDQLTDNILNVMAWQWHLENFDANWPEKTKRGAIKQSLIWHRKKGTKAIVQDVIDKLFAKCMIEEWYEYNGKPYMFRLKGSLDDIKTIAPKKNEIIHTINSVKNVRSWLDYIVLFASNPFKLNSCKRDDLYIPETHKTTWVTGIVFKTGLNKSCGTAERTENSVVRIEYHETIFSGKKINGKFRRIVLNDSQPYKKQWATTKNDQKKEKAFNTGGYSLNNVGITQIKKIDIGYDKEVIEKQFTRGTTNNGVVKINSKDQTLHITHRWKTFKTNTVNGGKDIRLNSGQVQEYEKSEVKITHTTMKTFAGALTNGRRLTNNNPTTTIRRMVHTPIYKDIVQKYGATLLNMTDHTTKKRAVETTVPGKIIKRFSPTKGVILNSHALMGYIKI